MKLHLPIAGDFGPRLGDGSLAAKYRVERIDPYVELCEEIAIDFTGTRIANSSFMNALVAGLVEHHGEKVLKVLVFRGCNPTIQVLVEAAIDLGLQKVEGRVSA